VYNENHALTDINMGAGDVLTFLVTKYPTFHYKVLTRYY
jgi:hypothetical protein